MSFQYPGGGFYIPPTNPYSQSPFQMPYQSNFQTPFQTPYQVNYPSPLQPSFPQNIPFPSIPQQQPNIFTEQSYVENILRLNKGKVATVYMNFETGSQSGNMVFKGVIEAAGKDHIILSDTVTKTRYVLLTIYLLYITFDEEINYYYPYSGESNISV